MTTTPTDPDQQAQALLAAGGRLNITWHPDRVHAQLWDPASAQTLGSAVGATITEALDKLTLARHATPALACLSCGDHDRFARVEFTGHHVDPDGRAGLDPDARAHGWVCCLCGYVHEASDVSGEETRLVNTLDWRLDTAGLAPKPDILEQACEEVNHP